MTDSPGYLRVSPGADYEFEVVGGLAPFTWATRFRLMANEEEWPFVWLRSLDDAALCLVAVPLSLLFPEHADRALSALITTVGPSADDAPLVLGLVVLDPDPALITVNLLAPVILDTAARRAHQAILEGPLEQVRTPLAPALRALAA